jgi:hypothetical protein
MSNAVCYILPPTNNSILCHLICFELKYHNFFLFRSLNGIIYYSNMHFHVLQSKDYVYSFMYIYLYSSSLLQL